MSHVFSFTTAGNYVHVSARSRDPKSNHIENPLMSSLAWAQFGPSLLTGFLASAVEFLEALTVILAVGSVRGWRDALLGMAGALIVLLMLVVTLGNGLTTVPLELIQIIVGALTLLFGLRWLRKATLRAAGRIPLRNGAAAFARQAARMHDRKAAAGWDRIAFATTFQITLLEGVEVVFIVIAIGAGGAGLLVPACVGATLALLLVLAVGLAMHRPLSRIPENGLKFAVGVLLSGFGCFWFGEGIGIDWPGADLILLPLVFGFLGAALLAVRLCRQLAPVTVIPGARS